MKDVLGNDDTAAADESFDLDVLDVMDHLTKCAGALGLHVDALRFTFRALGLAVGFREAADAAGLLGLGVDLLHGGCG